MLHTGTDTISANGQSRNSGTRPRIRGRFQPGVAVIKTPTAQALLFGLGFWCASLAVAQDKTPPADEPIVITITGGRIAPPVDRAPAAISVVDQDKIQRGTQQLGLDESLAGVPGLFMQNRYNFAQDLRISMRGFGARANFGIRGIKILVDGVPQTLPDGQGQVDSIDLGSAQQIDVIRGPASSLWGNASGGVINITTEDGPIQPFVDASAAVGDFGYRKYQIKAAGERGSVNYLANGSRLELDGYRDHSQVENNLFNSKMRFSIDESANLVALLNLTDSPIAQDPGALTRDQMNADPTQASQRNVAFDAGEQVDQQKLSFVYNKAFDDRRKLTVRNYYVWRDFENRLPFVGGGAVRLDRFFVGGGVLYTHDGQFMGRNNRLAAGIDLDNQNDDRQRFDNNQGILGALAFDQKETVTGTGAFVRTELSATEQLDLFVGARFDSIRFDVDDRFLINGDDSGERTIEQLSPMIGIVYDLTPRTNLYANVSTSFETPTTAEFANPSGQGGLNPELEPQTATNYEIGIKGSTTSGIRYEAALFHINIEDELIPFEVAGQPGRTFFVNAGESNRDGIELTLSAPITRHLNASVSYTYSDFVFDRFEDSEGNIFDGNRIPGVPKDLLHVDLAYQRQGFFAEWDFIYVGDFYVDNANSEQNDSYTVSNAKAGYTRDYDNWKWKIHLGVNNLFDAAYAANVRINAFGGRYFEPAPERNLYAGFHLRYLFDL